MRPPDRPTPTSRLQELRARLHRHLTRDIWSMELGGLPTFRAAFYKASRVLFLAVRGFVKDRCLNRAAALTYITVLSIVPMLAFAFSVAKGLGAYDTLLNETVHPFLDRSFGTAEETPPAGTSTTADPIVPAVVPEPGVAPEEGAGDSALELRRAIDQVLSFVQDANFASVGAFGLLVLIWTVISLLGSVEHSFNDIWGVHKARTLVRKLSDYLSILVIVPILLVAATGAAASLRSPVARDFLTEKLHLGALWAGYLQVLPLAVMWIAFMAIYLFMPNTRVRFLSAFIGGVAGGTLWQLAQILHLKFQVGMAKYSAIYSTFAAFPIFLFWLYVCWITVLLGAELAYAHQNEPAYRQVVRTREHDHAFKEALAVRAMARISVAFVQGDHPWRLGTLATALGVPDRTLTEVIQALRRADILAMTEDELDLELELLPSRDLDRIRLLDVLDGLRGKKGGVRLPQQGAADRSVDGVLARYEEERRAASHNYTMRELARTCLEDETREAQRAADAAPEVSVAPDSAV